MLAQLLDRVAAVLEDAGVAVDVGDRAATRRGVHVRGVVGHQPEVLVVGLDLAQVDRAHRAVLDRQLVALAGAVVGDRERRPAASPSGSAAVASPVIRRRSLRRRVCPRSSAAGCSWLLLSAVSQALCSDYERPRRGPGTAAVAARDRAQPVRQALAASDGAHARGRALGAGSPCGPRRGRARQPRARMMRVARTQPRTDAAVLSGRLSGVWPTAQRTIMNSATIGIFSRTISQMNVQVVTRRDRIPGAGSVQAPDMHTEAGAARRRRCGPGERLSRAAQRRAAELRHRVQLVDARGDLLAGQALQALGAELLDVERREHGRVRHRAAQQLVGELARRGGRRCSRRSRRRTCRRRRSGRSPSPADRRAARRSPRA